MNQYSELEQRLLNDFQHGLPLSSKPFSDIAAQLGVDEETVIEHLQRLQEQGVISRVGAVFRPNRVGVSTLAAMQVPPDELAMIAEIISGFEEVNHNYEREHCYNLWFVVTATDDVHLRQTLLSIEHLCSYAVMDLPMLKDFHIDLGFDLKWT